MGVCYGIARILLHFFFPKFSNLMLEKLFGLRKSYAKQNRDTKQRRSQVKVAEKTSRDTLMNVCIPISTIVEMQPAQIEMAFLFQIKILTAQFYSETADSFLTLSRPVDLYDGL